ncbi:ABC transporter permease [Ferrimicrobium sp.]|uniref:ABC transporter permease n=1 Tax=Ferrimicrobium sp. TaxID=2926050 RepID=UPI00263130E6|nr:ABC transporter permease [Ferrimicrobium sp.]
MALAELTANPHRSRLYWMTADALTITKRNLLNYVRIPQSLVFSTIQPVMFVLLFRYVFGGAIGSETSKLGLSYVNYLMPGIFIQTIAFGSVQTGVGLAEDLQKGIIERFHALPMTRSAVLAGRTIADLIRNLVVIVIMVIVGFLVGFRIGTNVGEFLAGIGIALLFAYALSWFFALIGLAAPNSETAQVMAFPLLFPLTFASSAFVPVETMPSWLRGFANHQPLSVAVNAARSLMDGPVAAHAAGSSTGDLTLTAIIWCVGLLIIMIPLSVNIYRKRV